MTGLLSGCPPPSQQALWHRAGTEDKSVLGGAGGPRSQARATEVSGGEHGVGVPAKEYTRRAPRVPRGLECWPSFPIADVGAQSRAGWAKGPGERSCPRSPPRGTPEPAGLSFHPFQERNQSRSQASPWVVFPKRIPCVLRAQWVSAA